MRGEPCHGKERGGNSCKRDEMRENVGKLHAKHHKKRKMRDMLDSGHAWKMRNIRDRQEKSGKCGKTWKHVRQWTGKKNRENAEKHGNMWGNGQAICEEIRVKGTKCVKMWGNCVRNTIKSGKCWTVDMLEKCEIFGTGKKNRENAEKYGNMWGNRQAMVGIGDKKNARVDGKWGSFRLIGWELLGLWVLRKYTEKG